MISEEDLYRYGTSRKAETVRYIIFSLLLIAIILLPLFFSISKVEGTSMRNTIQDNDLLICVPKFSLKRGDIVTAEVENPVTKSSKYLVKRIVALPGDRIIFKATGQTVSFYLDTGNGFEIVSEDYLYESEMQRTAFINSAYFYSGNYFLYDGDDVNAAPEEYIITLKEKEYFLLGDNRNSSLDSRTYGPFLRSKIKGKVLFIIGEDSGAYKFFDFLYSFKGNNIDKRSGIYVKDFH